MNMMNKKKLLIISVLIIVVLLGIYLLYNTFAINNTNNTNDTYVINLTDDNNKVDVPSKSSKIVYYKINNTNDGTVKYGVSYSSNNVIVKVYEDSKDPETGLISSKDNKFVKLKLINNSTSNDTVTLSTIFGYENGGNLIVPSGNTLVTKKIKKVNTLKNTESSPSATTKFLNTSIVRNTIESITMTNDNIVPLNAIGSFDISKDNDGSIMMWYTKGSSDSLYNVYIGSESGIVYAPTNCYYLFAYLINAKKIDLSYFDTSNTTYMEAMFGHCESLTSLDLSMFDTSKVTNMLDMFTYCKSLVNLNLDNFNTSKVTTMYRMFFNCNALSSLDLSSFDTSNVTNMCTMFTKCYALKTLDLSNFNTSNVTNMLGMFQYCTSLTKLNISSFDTSNVTNMSAIFSCDSKLTLIDMRNMTFSSKLTDYASMFLSVPNTATIYVKSNTEKSWLNTNYSSLTGITVVS